MDQGTKNVADYTQSFTTGKAPTDLELRKEAGRGFTSTEDCFNTSSQILEDQVKNSKERIVKAAKGSLTNIYTDRIKAKTWKQNRKKQMFGYFKRQISEIATKARN